MPRWRRKSSGARAGHCCHIKRNSSTQSKSIASQVAPDIVVPQVPNIRHCTVIDPSSCLKFPKAPWLYTVEFAGNPSTHTPPSAGTSFDLRYILQGHQFASVINYSTY